MSMVMQSESKSGGDIHSFWQHAYGPYVPELSLREDIKVDVAIIGGGFTGLNTAWQFKKDNPGARVVVVEAQIVGHGASGRNAGFSTKIFGMEPELVLLRWGRQKMIDAHHYLQRAVAHTKQIIESNNIDSDYRHNGLVRASYNDSQLSRMKKTYELFQKLGIDGDMTWQSVDRFRQDFGSDRFSGGIYEAETGHLNPCKQVRALKELALSAGVEIYEKTPVSGLDRMDRAVRVRTAGGTITADRVVVATNSYTREVPGPSKLRARQYPLWTYVVITQPLSEGLWRSIGWNQAQSFGDNRQMLHYFRPTPDGRILMGGGDAVTYRTGAGTEMPNPDAWKHCEDHLKWIYPQLRDTRIDYRWGGPVSVNADMVPEISFIGDERIVYSGGCFGHGVALAHLNGRTIADLLNGSRTELTDFWIVNRSSLPMPGDGLSFLAGRAARAGLKAWDRWEERRLGE